ncbi:MAG: ABC transporter substrate-binding protein [Desulfosoma sp.]
MELVKRLGLLLSFLVLGFSMQGCSFRDPIHIGFVGPMTGRFSDLGVHGRNGAVLAVEAVNASGGVNGHPFELLIEDDESTVPGALAAVERLLSQGVRLVLGPMTTTQVSAVLPAVDQADGVCLSPTASSQTLDARKDALFRMAPSDRFQVELLAKRMLLDRRLRTLVIVWDADNEAYTRSYAEASAQAYVRRGGIVLAQHAFRSSVPGSWKHLAMPIFHAGSDAVLVVASAKDTAYFCQWLAKQGVTAALFTSFWARSPELLLYGGRTVEGLELVSAVDFEDTSLTMKAFVDKYRQRFGKAPNQAAVFSFEAVRLLERAMAQSLSTHLPLRETLLEDHHLVGLTGPLRLNSSGDRLLPSIVEALVQGRFQVVYRAGETG